MRFSTALTAVAVAATGAQALSSQCTAQIGLLAFSDLGSCLQLTSLLPVLQGSGSIVTPINTYLGSLCASGTATCTNATLTSAQSSIQSGCSSDISSGGSDGATVSALVSVLQSYTPFKTAACSKNSTTGAYCVTDTLQAVQNATGSDVSVSTLTALLVGQGDASQLTNAFGTGRLCTGCVSTIYQQAVIANASVASSGFGTALKSQCGSSFGTTSASGVSISSSASATSAVSSASSAAASTSRSAGESVHSITSLLPVAIAGVSVVGAMALGGLSVL